MIDGPLHNVQFDRTAFIDIIYHVNIEIEDSCLFGSCNNTRTQDEYSY